MPVKTFLKKNSEIDYVGQYYTGIGNVKNPGNFSISVHLNETLHPELLQKAFHHLTHSFPFLRGKLKKGFFHYSHEITPKNESIKKVEKPVAFNSYNAEGHTLQLTYNPYSFNLETTHALCDGRSLSELVALLLERYFELLDETLYRRSFMLSTELRHELTETALIKLPKTKATTDQKAGTSAYQISGEARDVHTQSYTFSVKKIRQAAKSAEASINDFLLAYFFQTLGEERKKEKQIDPITTMVPIDLRQHFPVKTLRNFVSRIGITVKKTEHISDIITSIQAQFSKITAETLAAQHQEWQDEYKKIELLPLSIKKWFYQRLTTQEENQCTTTFSNLGLIKLPENIEKRIRFAEFFIDQADENPFSLSCVSVGDHLTLSATSSLAESQIFDHLVSKLQQV